MVTMLIKNKLAALPTTQIEAFNADLEAFLDAVHTQDLESAVFLMIKYRIKEGGILYRAILRMFGHVIEAGEVLTLEFEVILQNGERATIINFEDMVKYLSEQPSN